jgi:hypothetical protein
MRGNSFQRACGEAGGKGRSSILFPLGNPFNISESRLFGIFENSSSTIPFLQNLQIGNNSANTMRYGKS